MPVVKGRKTDKEKFAGAEATYTIECMMKDHKALQSGTSHFFGDKFSRAYDVTFTGRDNTLQYPFQTSWGASTRLIGAIIMTHSDNHGLVLPPVIAPTQVVVIPIAQHKEGVLEAAAALRDRLSAAGIRVSMDDSDQSAGWKFAQYEMKGVPLRVEIGPKDMEKGQCCIARRDTGEKTFVPLTELENAVKQLLQDVHDNLYAMAEKNLEDNTLQYPFQTSWGASTRLIGAIIMTHSDNHGLVLPPVIAPTQVVVIPIAQHKEGVLEAAASLRDRLTAAGIRVSMDDSDQSAGWKFAQYEMKGVPLRVEIGPKDMEKGQCCIARRDTGEKTFVPLTELESAVQKLLQDVHDNLYAMAAKNLEDNTFDMTSWEEVKEMAQGKGGFARTKWCGSLECELAMKEKAGVSSRCMPLKQSGTEGKCVMCGKPATTDIYWGVAY